MRDRSLDKKRRLDQETNEEQETCYKKRKTICNSNRVFEHICVRQPCVWNWFETTWDEKFQEINKALYQNTRHFIENQFIQNHHANGIEQLPTILNSSLLRLAASFAQAYVLRPDIQRRIQQRAIAVADYFFAVDLQFFEDEQKQLQCTNT